MKRLFCLLLMFVSLFVLTSCKITINRNPNDGTDNPTESTPNEKYEISGIKKDDTNNTLTITLVSPNQENGKTKFRLVQLDLGDVKYADYLTDSSILSAVLKGNDVTIGEEKKTADFKLTYETPEYLYIVRGYGEQATGGYSIQVKELYLTSNAVFFSTELIGPRKGENAVKSPSYPFIVIRTEKREENMFLFLSLGHRKFSMVC